MLPACWLSFHEASFIKLLIWSIPYILTFSPVDCPLSHLLLSILRLLPGLTFSPHQTGYFPPTSSTPLSIAPSHLFCTILISLSSLHSHSLLTLSLILTFMSPSIQSAPTTSLSHTACSQFHGGPLLFPTMLILSSSSLHLFSMEKSLPTSRLHSITSFGIISLLLCLCINRFSPNFSLPEGIKLRHWFLLFHQGPYRERSNIMTSVEVWEAWMTLALLGPSFWVIPGTSGKQIKM